MWEKRIDGSTEKDGISLGKGNKIWVEGTSIFILKCRIWGGIEWMLKLHMYSEMVSQFSFGGE